MGWIHTNKIYTSHLCSISLKDFNYYSILDCISDIARILLTNGIRFLGDLSLSP